MSGKFLEICSMAKAYIFPGQGSQYVGMAKDLYEHYPEVKKRMDAANDILGYPLTKVMFEGPEEELKQTHYTQPAIFLHSILLYDLLEVKADMVAGHSLGEFSALYAARVVDFESALTMVKVRALAMQEACEKQPSTMAAIIGLPFHQVEEICANINDIVVPANYNAPGQLVISGTVSGVEKAMEACKKAGAKLVKQLKVGGAFHSPLMEPAKEKLAEIIHSIPFHIPQCPIYQNVSAKGELDPTTIKQNLIQQLTSPVKWAQSIEQMIQDGATHFFEVGPGKVLSGLMKRINPNVTIENIETLISSNA